MKVWISKYALTKGIYETDGEICTSINENMFYSPSAGYFHNHPAGIDEWHMTKGSAIRTAEQMRIKKIASLKKQIEKLENLDFERSAS